MITVRCPLGLSLPKEGSETQNGRFSCKIAIRLHAESLLQYKVSLCESLSATML